MRIVSLYAIDTTWWIAISTLGKAGKLGSNTRAELADTGGDRLLSRYISRNWEALLKPIKFCDDGGITPWVSSRGKVENLLRFKASWLSGIAPKIIPAVVRSRDFITEVSEYIREVANTYTRRHTYVYIHVYTAPTYCHQLPRNPSDPRPSYTPFPYFPLAINLSQNTTSSPIRQDGHLMLDISSSLSSLLHHCAPLLVSYYS